MKKLPLRKQIIFALIVGGVAFATSALLAFFAAAAAGGRAQPGPSPLIGLSFGVVAGVIYLALAGNKKMAMADAGSRSAALMPVADGTAQLLVYRQGFVGKLAGVNVYVDDELRTQLKSPRFASLSVPPGRHVLVTEVQNKRSEPLELTVAPNETAAVQILVTLGKSALSRQDDVAAVRATLADMPMVAA